MIDRHIIFLVIVVINASNKKITAAHACQTLLIYWNVDAEVQCCPLSLAVAGVGVPGLYQGGMVPGKGKQYLSSVTSREWSVLLQKKVLRGLYRDLM